MRERNIPVVLVSHDPADIADPDRVLQLGTLEANGAPMLDRSLQALLRPALMAAGRALVCAGLVADALM